MRAARIRRYWVDGAAAIILLLGVSCERMPSSVVFDNPLDPRGGGTSPLPPPAVTGRWGNQQILLSWPGADTSAISFFRVYRRSPADAAFVLRDSTFSRSYVDARLANGAEYSYQVAAVDNRGLEGRRSSITRVTPHALAIVINDGEVQTDSLAVTLALSAPSLSTQSMRMANDSLSLANASWFPYSPSPLAWTLSSEGDSVKTVYGQFLNTRGQESMTVSDWIILK